MNNHTLFFIGLFLIFALVGCKYDEVPLVQPCPDDTNPECPCPNPSNPSCVVDPCDNPANPNCCDDPNNPDCCDDPPFPDCVSFQKFEKLLIGSSMLNCNTPLIEEVVELPNGEGYVMVGFCSDLSGPNTPNRRALVIHIDTAGNVLCSPQHTLLGDDFFKSVDIKNGEVIATGHTRSSGSSGSDVFNFKIGSNSLGYCTGSGSSFNDPSLNQLDNKWDQGNSIVITNSSTVVVGGKGSIYASLFESSSTSNLNDIVDYENYDLDDFNAVAPNMIAVTSSNTCEVDHHVNKIIQTGDDGFLFTGLINTDDSGQTLSKAYLTKTKGASISVTPTEGFIKIFDNNESLGKNTVGRDIAEVASGFSFVIAGYGFDENVPDNFLACGAPEFSSYDYNGFLIMIDAFQGLVESKQFFDVTNQSRDFINGISTLKNKNTNMGSDTDIVAIGSVWRNNTEKLQVKHYKIENNQLLPGSIVFNIDSPSNKKTVGKDIIPTSDGGFLIIANERNGSGGAESIRVIKTDPDGNF